MADSRFFTINLMGDVMLGRLIDQLFPIHVDCPEEARLISSSRASLPHLKAYGPESPWGDFLALIRSGDINIINLETSVTTHDKKWPDKVFNYRMHPANIAALAAASIDYVSLANNHTLDFGEVGLMDTIKSIRNFQSTKFGKESIKFAGAGETEQLAQAAASLLLPRHALGLSDDRSDFGSQRLVLIYSFCDHPREWASIPQFNFIDYLEASRQHLKGVLSKSGPLKYIKPDLKIVSIHWGPNYSWSPSADIKSLAHFFIDECGVDLIHGHSSHHIQGVEIYKKKLIIYGCGDFVDDYAVVREFRNDLSALWRVIVSEEDDKLQIKRLEVFPNKIKNFQASLLNRGENNHEWLTKRFRELCSEMGTKVQDELETEGQMVIEVS
jgi:poly-gamma-glutamate capsule biosynthesis protein CapA/YwtB (metallophosphatase superfamily)